MKYRSQTTGLMISENKYLILSELYEHYVDSQVSLSKHIVRIKHFDLDGNIQDRRYELREITSVKQAIKKLVKDFVEVKA